MASNVSDQVLTMIAETLDVPPAMITTDSSIENLDEWDSLAQVNLMMALEQTFDLTLEVDDFAELDSAAKITDYINANSAE